MQTQLVRRSLILSLGWLFLSSAQATQNSGAVRENSAPSNVAAKPCPTCAQSIGLEAFKQSVRGEVVPVLVELQEAAGLMHRLKAEQNGKALGFAELTAHGASLLGKQKAFLASLQRRGVRALLRESNVRQVDGSVRHIQYQLTYLVNGFVAYVPADDLARLRALPEVRQILQIQPTKLLLDKAIDYSLGLQTNILARRDAVYGATKEFVPAAGVSGHPEAPKTNKVDGFEGQNIIVAVVDTGVDWRHPMFGGIGQTTAQPRASGNSESSNDNRKVIYYYAMSSPGDPTDDFGHGTLVSSCIAGYLVDGTTPPRTGYGTGQDGTGIGPTPNGVALHGTAPQARLMEYKVCGPANNCLGDIELAVEDAASPYTIVGASGGNETNTFIPKPVADVINLSLGNSGGDPAGATSFVVNNAALAGTIVVASAGNDGPAPGTLGEPAAATLAVSVAASYDPGSIAVADLLATNQVPTDTRLPGAGGPPPETGAASTANSPQPGGRQTMKLFYAAGGGLIPNGSISAHYVFVDRRANANNSVPPEVQNRIALVKGTGTFFQMANTIAPLMPAAILIITDIETATALTVVGGVPTFTIGPSDGNYLIDKMRTGDAGDGDDSVDVPVGTISELPLRLGDSAALDLFQPGMAGFSSRGPSDHPNARFRVVKPDVTAPGVGILGAATPDGTPSETIGLADPSGYIQASGTSFSGPITSGAMALLRQRARELGFDATDPFGANSRSTRFNVVTITRAWLMNSASNLRSGLGVPEGNGASSTASINDMGAGHINIDGALHANAIMVAPTLLLRTPTEFVAPTNDPPPASQFDANTNLIVLIPSASFGAVPIVGVNATLVQTQQVIIRDVTGSGGGTYNLSFQNNRNADQPSFQISFVSAAGAPISSVTVPSNGQTNFGVRVAANGNLINVNPTEFQWYVTATHNSSGQTLRMPFYYRAVLPDIPNVTAPVLQPVIADQPPQPPSSCMRDTNSSYSLQWSYTAPSGGPAPVGFRVQEGTRTTQIFFDNANTLLPTSTNWVGGNDWSSQVNPNSGSLAYYVPDSANQNSSLSMINSFPVPAGGATLNFLTTQDLEDTFDQAFVEISTDGGASYVTVAVFMNDFVGTRSLDISPYAGNAVKIRFRMVSDLLNGPPDATPVGWYVEDIAITSDDFHTIASPPPSTTSLSITGRGNGTYYYRVAGLFSTALGTAPGPYSDSKCVTEILGTPRIAGITMLGNGHALLYCQGQPGLSHRVQGSGDLRNWNTLGNGTPDATGNFQFEDTTSTGIGVRFYRLVLP